MPPIEVTCSNPDCGEKFQVGSEMAGELVECPTCGASVYVLEPGDSSDELQLADVPKAGGGEKNHIAHPARQQCPNCGAVLGVRDAFCPECGADIRTGAAVTTTVERKKVNLAPFLIGGGILVALVALVALIVFAVKIVSQKREQAAAAQQAAAAAAAPVARVAPAAPPPPPKPAYEIPQQVLSDLADQELQASQAVDGYMAELQKTLVAVHSAAPGQKAARWADLYQYCKDKGLTTEADQAWYQAVRQGSSDGTVNQKLGLTASYQGVPVSPAEKQFLDGLKPRLLVINHDPLLKDDVIVVEGSEPAPIPLGKTVQLTPPAGALTLAIARPDRTDRPLEEFSLTVEPGVVQTVEIYNALAAPSVPLDAMKAIFVTLQGGTPGQPNPAAGAVNPYNPTAGPAGPEVNLERDAEQRVTAASAGEVRVVGSSDDPVTMQLTSRQDQLIVSGSIPLGDRFEMAGLRLLSGSRVHPLTLALPADGTSPLRLTSGAYCVVHADLAEGLWGMLGAINGDLAYEYVRSSLVKRIDDVSFENAQMEARGELYGPWQTRVRLSEALTARQEELQQTIDEERSAAGLPLFSDRARLLGRADSTGSVYLNWPRFRRALALAMKGATPALVERLELINAGGAARTTVPGRTTRMTPTAAVRAAMTRRPATTTAATPDRDAAPFQPPTVAMDDEARTYALMRLLPLLPDDAVLQQVEEHWADLAGEQRMAALMAVEQVGTPQAVAWLGRLAQNATDTDVTSMALLSLGAIGTPEALAQTQVPGVSPQVQAASLVAPIIAGDPDAIAQMPNFLANASPDESAAFLQYLTQFDTPAVLPALGHAIDVYSDAKSTASIGAALARIGGKAAMRELSRLMGKTNEVYADKLGTVRAEDALLLLRQVGGAVAGQKKPDANAIRLLTEDGSQASICFLLSSAVNQGDADVLPALCRMGNAAALQAAGQLVKDLTLPMLSDLRKQWLTPKPDGSGSTWSDGVDGGAARAFLEQVFTDGSDAKVRIAAATMLSQVDRALPPDQLLAFAASVGAPASGTAQGAPKGFEWPEAEPMLPQDFTFDGAPGLYAIGLALQAKDPSLAGALQGMLGSVDSGPLKGAAMVALGRLGGDDNLKFLRDAAARSQAGYADSTEMGNVLEDRLAAMAGLGAAQDAAFLPRAMDMLQEAPPAGATAGSGEAADWWQITLWRGAADCVAGICSQRSPLELTADSGLQSMLTDRLKELIDNPGPKRDSLSDARQELRAAAIRAFGRVGDFNDPSNSFVLSRLVVDLSQPAAPASRTVRAPAGRRPAAPTASAQPESLRIAVLDAVAHAGARVQNASEFVDYARQLASTPALQDAWNAALRRMANQPTGGYFALLAAGFDTLNAQAGTGLFEATEGSAEAKGQQYGTFLAALIAPPEAPPAGTRVAARAATAGRSVGPPPGGPLAGLDIQAMMEENRRQGMAAAAELEGMYGPPGGFGRGAGPARAAGTSGRSRTGTGVVPEYDRQLPYKRTDWEYKPDESATQVADLKTKWSIIQGLIEGSGAALPTVVQDSDLLSRADVGPVAAPPMLKQDASRRDSVIASLGELLAPAPAAAEPTAPGPRPTTTTPKASPDARRAAVEALRRIGGKEAVDALYTGLVGRQIDQQQAANAANMRAMMGGQIPAYAARAMQASRAANVDPVPVLIARALGSMGQDGLLRGALSATDRQFFVADAVAVQAAALGGMAFLPAASDPVNMLANLVRAAATEQLRQAAASALVTAARLSSQQG